MFTVIVRARRDSSAVYPVESNMLAMQPLRHDMHVRYTLV
jgi:hypothetical protein